MPIQCVGSDDGEPVTGDAWFIYPDGKVEGPYSTSHDGWVSMPRAGALAVQVSPHGEHWSCVASKLREGETIPCAPSEAKHWLAWKELIVGTLEDQSAGRGNAIGVIDTRFPRLGSLAHVDAYSLEGKKLAREDGSPTAHGRTVCSIIAARSDRPWIRGIAPGASVVAVDVGQDPVDHTWPMGNIAAAVEMLSAEHRVDIINISAGVFLDPKLRDGQMRRMDRVVREAFERGTLVVAAAGNESKTRVAEPAGVTHVIGVSSIGFGRIAPEGSMLRMIEDNAMKKHAVKTKSGRHVFTLPDRAYGEGLDAVAPGLGIFVETADGRMREFEGTSFSSPAVVGVLARSLAVDEAFAGKSGSDRAKHAETRLKDELCVKTGLDGDHEGWGLPVC